jgi:hypothetical protein
VDGSVHDAEERAELAELRRRAFGPDADILDDPAALERLRALERVALQAPPHASSTTAGTQVVDADPGRPVGSTPTLSATATNLVAVSAWTTGTRIVDDVRVGEDDVRRVTDAGGRLHRLRRAEARFAATRPGRIASVIAVSVVIAAVSGAIGWEVAQPRPDRILVADGTHYTPTGEGTDLWLKEMYGITGAFRGHEPYGNVHVYTGTARDGSECMVVMMGADDAIATSCSPRPLAASADLFVYPGWTEQFTGLDLPAGSVVRFTQAGDDVEVWIGVMPTTRPAL